MGISYIEMNEQKIPIEDEELRGVVPTMQGDIDILKGTIGYSKKNLIPYPHYSTTFTQNGITWTDNGDGTVTANGTATGETTYFVRYRTGNPLPINEGKYILSGCPSGGSANGYNLFIGNTVNGALNVMATDYGESVDFITEDTEIGVFIKINSSATVNNLTFYPMIRYASIEDDTYEPYVADLKSLVCNVEKILKKIDVACTKEWKTHYSYTANRRCIVNLSFSAMYSNNPPKGVCIADTTGGTNYYALQTDSSTDTSNHLTALSVSASVLLEVGETVMCNARYYSAGTNNCTVCGYIQYLE